MMFCFELLPAECRTGNLPDGRIPDTISRAGTFQWGDTLRGFNFLRSMNTASREGRSDCRSRIGELFFVELVAFVFGLLGQHFKGTEYNRVVGAFSRLDFCGDVTLTFLHQLF